MAEWGISEAIGGWRIPLEMMATLVKMGAVWIEMEGQEYVAESVKFTGDGFILTFTTRQELSEKLGQ